MSMKPILKYVTLSLTTIAFSSFSFSQELDTSEPLVTDRPDATEASSTVGKGVLQFEIR